MKSTDMNIIISKGLVIMGNIAVVGWIILSYNSGTSSGTEIPIAIVSGLGGVLTGKNMAEKAQQERVAEMLAEAASAAEGAQDIVQTVESLKKMGEK